jgi:hypothetical protein
VIESAARGRVVAAETPPTEDRIVIMTGYAPGYDFELFFPIILETARTFEVLP